jgi:hypothetical protein
MTMLFRFLIFFSDWMRFIIREREYPAIQYWSVMNKYIFVYKFAEKILIYLCDAKVSFNFMEQKYVDKNCTLKSLRWC